MRTRAIGRTRLEVTEVSLGGAAFGNLYRETTDDEVTGAVEAAWENGWRYFDTAPHYGLGLSERRLGRELAKLPRSAFLLSSKVGRLLVPSPETADARDPEGFDVPADTRRTWDFSRDGIRASVEASLQRLGLDRIDILYLHDPDDHWEQALGEGYRALDELRAEGVVSAIGVGMNQWQMPEAFVRETDIDVVMLAGRYTLLEQEALDSFLPLCLGRGVSVVDVGVFNSGMLAHSRPPEGATYNYEAAPHDLLERAHRIADVCDRHAVTLPAVALALPLAHPAVATVTLGCRNAQQVQGNVDLVDAQIPPDLWAELKAEGLLREDAPTP